MKEELKKKYNIELVSLLRKTDKTYLIDSNNGKYILKYLSSNDENIYKRLSLLDCSSYYVLPLLSNNKKYIEYFNNKYYALFPYLEDEFISSKELRLSLYIKALAFLHKESKYPININDTYLNESISYLDECVDKVEFDIINKIEIIEK